MSFVSNCCNAPVYEDNTDITGRCQQCKEGCGLLPERPATTKQRDLFLSKAVQYHKWDRQFINILKLANYKLISSQEMSEMINLMFRSYREPKLRETIVEKVRHYQERG